MVDPQLDIAGVEFDGCLEQEIGILVDAQSRADISEQAHALNMLRLFAQEAASNFFGAENAAFVQVICHGEQFARQRLYTLKLSQSLIGFSSVASGAKQIGLRLPTGGQRRVAARGVLESDEGPAMITDSLVQMPFFLEGAAIVGGNLF